MSSDNNLQKMERDIVNEITEPSQSKTAVNANAAPGNPLPKEGSNASGVSTPGNTPPFEDLGGPTVDNASPTNDSAKLKDPAGSLKQVRDVVTKKGAKADPMKGLNSGDEVEIKDDQEVVAEEPAVEEDQVVAEAETTEEEVVAEAPDYTEISIEEDVNALVAGEELSEEFKEKTAVIFEAAIKSKLVEEIDRFEEKYNEELDAEINSTKEDLVEKVDSYLNYVVENWMEDNKLAIQTGLRTEIAEGFMNNLKDLFTESYIEVPESKIDLVDELAETVEELEEKLNSTTGNAIAMAEELESYKRDAIIAEHSKDLADTQIAKLKSLVEDVDFDDEETFSKKVATVKESYFTKESVNVETADIDTDESDDIVESSGSMAQYISALKATQS